MERVKYNRVEVSHGNTSKKFPVYEIYLDGVIITKEASDITIYKNQFFPEDNEPNLKILLDLKIPD